MNYFFNYKNDAKIHKKAIYSISKDPTLSTKNKELLQSSEKTGKWLSIGMQFPAIGLGTIFVNKKVVNFPKEKKFIAYTMGMVVYYFYFHATEAFAWHQAFVKAEPVIVEYVSNKVQEEMKVLTKNN